jgi:hypothetical protein
VSLSAKLKAGKQQQPLSQKERLGKIIAFTIFIIPSQKVSY